MAKTVSLLNMKGGVGKSTLTANLAWHLATAEDLSVLVVDLDPQFNVSQYLMSASGWRKWVEDDNPTVVEIFERDRPDARPLSKDPGRSPIVHVRDWGAQGCLHLIPSKLDFGYTLKHATGKERLLRNFLVRNAGRYDLILIDCPPTDSLATDAAFQASDYLVIPVKPEFLATIGLPLLAKSIELFRDKYEESQLAVAGIVFNDVMYSTENELARDDVHHTAKELDWYVFGHAISHSNSYPKGARQARSIMETDYARWDKRDELRDFASEFLDRIDLLSKRLQTLSSTS